MEKIQIPDEGSQSNVYSRAEGQSISKATTILCVVDDIRDGSVQSRNYAQPPIYLPSVLPDITPHVTRFPIRSILPTVGDQRLEVGMAWE